MRIQQQIDTIIHIGAGRCSEYEEYKAAGAKRIILIEPDPESARYLREHFAADTETQVIERAIAVSDGSIKLQLYNVRRFSSLREPTGLRDLYPGLRKVEEFYPDTWSPRQMCEELGIEKKRFNWLIVDAPGEEGSIIEKLREEGLLEQFERVSLYAGVSALYEGNLPAQKILSELGEMGYEDTAMDGEAEPERPRWTLYRDEVKLRNRELEQKTRKLNKLLQEHTEESKRLKAERDAVKQARHAAEKERDEKAKMLSELKSKLENTEKRLDEEKNRAATLHEEKTNAQSKNTELQNTINKLKDQLKKAQSENAELKSRQSMTQEEMRKAEGQIDLIKELLLRERG